MNTSSSQVVAIFGAAEGELPRLLSELGMRTVCLPLEVLSRFNADSRPVDVILVDLRSVPRLPDEVVGFKRRHPKIPVVLVTATLEPTLMLDAMRAGIAECVAEPLSSQALAEAVGRVTTQRLPDARGQLFAFVGAKGGIGTTTTAVNVATSLARAKERTLFIDLHIAYGDAALFLGAEPRFSVVDALENIHRLDDSVFKTLIVPTASGVDLLGSSTHGVAWSVDTQRVTRLLEFALQRYRYVVVDCPRSDAIVLDALEPATTIVLITNQDLAALRSGSRIAATLRQRYRPDRVLVAVSRFDAKSDIGRADIERVVGSPVRHFMPSDYRTSLEALNCGTPLITRNHTKLASSFDALSRELAGIAPAAKVEAKHGFLGLLTGRR